MRMTKAVTSCGIVLTLLFGTAGAQTTPSGQVVAPGAQGRRAVAVPCSGTLVTTTGSNANDANCIEAAPGFAAPALNQRPAESDRNIVAFVRVGAVIPRPPVTLPEGDSFSVAGSATLVKLRRAQVTDCLATGRRISARANASTSTTCLDRNGELLAYEECKPGESACTVLSSGDIAKQQEIVKQPGSTKPQ